MCLQTKTGITVPEVLVPFMGGTTFIPFTRERPVNTNKASMERAAAKKGGLATATAAAPESASAAAPAAPVAAAAAAAAAPGVLDELSS